MSLSRQGSPASMRGSSSGGTENRHKRKCVLNQHLAQTNVYGWPVWMRKPLGIFAFTNLFYEESEWQLVSESLSAEAYVGFLFPCYSTPDADGFRRGLQEALVQDPDLLALGRRQGGSNDHARFVGVGVEPAVAAAPAGA